MATSNKYEEETTIWLLERPLSFHGPNDRRTGVKEFLHYNDPESNSMFMHTFNESPACAMQFGHPDHAVRYAREHHIEDVTPVEAEVTLTFRFRR